MDFLFMSLRGGAAQQTDEAISTTIQAGLQCVRIADAGKVMQLATGSNQITPAAAGLSISELAGRGDSS
jgi:hypothetical protein